MCAGNRNAMDTARVDSGGIALVSCEASLARTQALTRRKVGRRCDSEAQRE
jgi:hypothetical protein